KPSPSSFSQRARSASGRAATWDSTNAATRSHGSWRYPSLSTRHIDGRAGGSASREAVIRGPFLVLGGAEALGLQLEHRAVAAPFCHELVVGAQLDDPAVL